MIPPQVLTVDDGYCQSVEFKGLRHRRLLQIACQTEMVRVIKICLTNEHTTFMHQTPVLYLFITFTNDNYSG